MVVKLTLYLPLGKSKERYLTFYDDCVNNESLAGCVGIETSRRAV